MIEVLHTLIVPVLEQRGFSGGFPDYRRITSRAVDLISFHFARHEAAFTVEVACAPLTGATIAGQVFVPPNQLTVWHVGPDERYRLGPDEPDQWFRFRKTFPSLGDTHVRAARALLPYLDSQAEAWWKQQSPEA
jgi:hypothetical protein